MNAVVELQHVSVTLGERTVLHDVDLRIPDGELVLVVGATGSGKSTLLRTLCSLVPHFSGGTLRGTVRVCGRDTRLTPPRELADVVGFVPQNPLESFVTDTVEEELAYVLENLGLDPATMRRRVEETLDLMSIADLRDRSLWELSGGQQQRVAIAAVLTAAPRVLLLDEPTSSLDPAAAEDVLAAISRLVHDLGLTVVVSEHRLERVLHLADQVLVLDGPAPRMEAPSVAMTHAPVAPPVVRLGRSLGWDPLPLTVRDGRRRAAELRELLSGPDPATAATAGDVAATVTGLTVRYGQRVALDAVDLAVRAGEITALMGRNGAGKSTLLSALAGALAPSGGKVRVVDSEPVRLNGRARIQRVGLVPQDPGSLLYGATVAEECRLSDREGDLAAGTTAGVLDSLSSGLDPELHTRDLSEGQRLTLALAVVTAHRPALLLLDEPTRGLDDASKSHLVELLGSLAAAGTAVLFATHDVELVAQAAQRLVVLAAGEVIADGPARQVAAQSAVFAPQLTKVMAPLDFLTADEVLAAITRQRAASGGEP